MNKKKILLYHMSGKGGGSDHSLYNLAKHLNKERFEVFVYVNRASVFDELMQSSGVKLINNLNKISKSSSAGYSIKKIKEKSKLLRRSKIFYYLYSTPKVIISSVPEAVKVFKLLKKYKIDVIHLNHSLSSDRSALIGGVFANVRIISHYRGLVKPEKIDLWLSRFVYKIVCISEFVKQEYISYGIDSNKCIVIHNGVDTTIFKPHYKKEKENLIIANIGRLETWKGQHIFLKAAAELVKVYDNLEFLIVGRGSQEEELKELAKELKIEDFVEFKGFVEKVPELLKEIDILVHSSIEPEPFGRVIIEGMAAGLPVIATNIGGPKEIIENGKDGILVEPNSVNGFYKALRYLIENEEFRKRLGMEAVSKIVEEFDISKNASQIMKVYEE